MKILVVVLPPWLSPASITFLIKMARCLNASTTVLGVVDTGRIARIAADEGSSRETTVENHMQEVYENLYAAEERYKKEAAEVSLKTVEVAVPEELLTEIKRSNAEVVCLAGAIDTLWLEIIRGALNTPILLIPQER